MKLENFSPSKKLILGILFDLIGMITLIDIIWAPLSGYIMTRMYPGKLGKTAGLITFLEELIPGLDVIPTFTIMWFYVHVFNSNKKTISVN